MNALAPRRLPRLPRLPRGVRERVSQWRADMDMVVRDLRGQRPPVYERRHTDRFAAHEAELRSSSVLSGRPVRVMEVRRDTPDSVFLRLEDPTGPVAIRPGQFFTVLVEIDGRTERRAYSCCTDVSEGSSFGIAIRRVEGGRVSNHLNDHLQVGDELRILGPAGDFGIELGAEAGRELVFIAGGSGITPMMSMAESVLRAEPETRIVLLFGNRDLEHVMFRDRLGELRRDHGDRFAMWQALERPPADWAQGIGRLDAEGVARGLDALGVSSGARFFLCGPAPMMEAARGCLEARGVAPGAIATELFSTPHRGEQGPRPSEKVEIVTLRRAGTQARFEVEPGETILDAAVRAGAPLPYSCAMGGCGRCKVKVLEGEIAVDEPNCLTSGERREGHALTCIGRPAGPCTVEVA